MPPDVKKYAGIYYPVGFLGEYYDLSPYEGLTHIYGREYQSQLTASGVPYDKDNRIVATWRYPLGTMLMIQDLQTGNISVGQVLDRGPNMLFYKDKTIFLDVSEAIALELNPNALTLGELNVVVTPICPEWFVQPTGQLDLGPQIKNSQAI